MSALGIFPECSSYQTSPGKTIADTAVKRGITASDDAAEIFAKDFQTNAANLDQLAPAPKAFRSRRAMLDTQCNRYLDAVGGANQAASNERKQVGLIRGFASAITGLTGSSATQIAGVATTFSFASASMDSFTTAYLFSDAAKSVTKIVRESQSAFLASLQGTLSNLDYAHTVALSEDEKQRLKSHKAAFLWSTKWLAALPPFVIWHTDEEVKTAARRELARARR